VRTCAIRQQTSIQLLSCGAPPEFRNADRATSVHVSHQPSYTAVSVTPPGTLIICNRPAPLYSHYAVMRVRGIINSFCVPNNRKVVKIYAETSVLLMYTYIYTSYDLYMSTLKQSKRQIAVWPYKADEKYFTCPV